MAEGKRKRSDRLAGQMARLVRGRPWLGWRHRRPMEAYTAARRRNALLHVGMNSAIGIYNITAGKLLFVPFMALISVEMGRTWHRLGKDPSGYQADWQEIRDALAETDAARAAGKYRRFPTPLAIAVLAVIGLAFPLQAKISLDPSWALLLGAGLVLAVVLITGDIYLHLRNVPRAVAAPPTAPDEDWDGIFPIAEYDTLTVGQIMPLLSKLYFDELPLVADRERDGKSRRTILQRLAQLESMLADAPEGVTAEEWHPQRRKAPSRTLAKV